MNLTKLETTWAEAAMGAIFPGSRDAGLTDIRAMDLRGFLAQVMATVPFQAALGLRLAVWIVALAPLFVLRRFATIAGLELAIIGGKTGVRDFQQNLRNNEVYYALSKGWTV